MPDPSQLLAIARQVIETEAGAVLALREQAFRDRIPAPLRHALFGTLARVYPQFDAMPRILRARSTFQAMAHSLEVRSPFLDHVFIEWATRLPSRLKLSGGEGKFVLKKAMEAKLPHDVLYRPKMGFAVPLAAWFRGPLRGEVERVLKGSALAETGWFDMRTLAAIADEHLSHRRDRSAAIWSVLMFERFVTGASGRLSVTDQTVGNRPSDVAA